MEVDEGEERMVKLREQEGGEVEQKGTGNRWREWWVTEEKKDKSESDNKCVSYSF